MTILELTREQLVAMFDEVEEFRRRRDLVLGFCLFTFY